jgi:hypothetical protein
VCASASSECPTRAEGVWRAVNSTLRLGRTATGIDSGRNIGGDRESFADDLRLCNSSSHFRAAVIAPADCPTNPHAVNDITILRYPAHQIKRNFDHSSTLYSHIRGACHPKGRHSSISTPDFLQTFFSTLCGRESRSTPLALGSESANRGRLPISERTSR